MERLAKFFSRTSVKYITLGVLFIIASLFSFLDAYVLSQVIANYGGDILEYFPTLAAFYLPLIAFIIVWGYYEAKREKGKENAMCTFGVFFVVVAGISFILHIVDMSISFGWTSLGGGSITWLFPWDVLILLAVELAIGIYVLYRYVVRKKNHVLDTLNYVVPLKKRTVVMVTFYSLFAAEFMGTFLFSFSLIDGYMDPNLYGVIPIVLSYLLMTAEAVIYIVYKEHNDSQKVFRNGLISLAATTFVLLIWVAIACCVNPQLISESLDGLNPVGYTIRMPLGMIVNMVAVIVPLIVALIYYILRYWAVAPDPIKEEKENNKTE